MRIEPIKKGVVILSLDITERKKAEERLKNLDQIKSAFIKIVSHQLRTPLTSIRWSLENLINIGNLSPEQKEITRLAYSAASEVNTRIDDLLVAIDIEEKRIVADKEDTRIDYLLDSVIKETDGIVKLKNITIKTSYPEQVLEPIKVDPNLIRHAIEKIIENAVIFSKENGQVTVTLSKKDSFVRIEVADDGIGIPEAEKAKIFGRFQRATNAFIAKSNSPGLGLYIAKSYVETNGGKIGFTSEEGKGSTFWVELPA